MGRARGADARQPATKTAAVRLADTWRQTSKWTKTALQRHHEAQHGTTWEQAAMERSKYRAFLHSGAMLAEATRTERVKEKRRRRKDRTSPEAGDPALMYQHCGHQFTAQIGLFAHLKWKHQQQ